MFLTALRTDGLPNTSHPPALLGFGRNALFESHPIFLGEKNCVHPHSIFLLLLRGKSLAEESDTVLLFLVLRGKLCTHTKRSLYLYKLCEQERSNITMLPADLSKYPHHMTFCPPVSMVKYMYAMDGVYRLMIYIYIYL